MPDFYTVVTDTGLQALGLAFTQGESFYLTQAVVGDGNGVSVIPNKGMTSLVNEVWRGNVAGVEVDPNDPNTRIFEFAIPADTGGFTVREVGLMDENGTLFCIGNFPVTEKPVAADGSVRDLVVRLPLHFENADVVNLIIDPAIAIATKQDVLNHNADPQAHRLATTLETGFVRLATDEEHIAHTRNTIAATPLGVWKLIEALKSDAVDLASSLRLATSQAVNSLRELIVTHTSRTDDPHGTLPIGGENGDALFKTVEGKAWLPILPAGFEEVVLLYDTTNPAIIAAAAYRNSDGTLFQFGFVRSSLDHKTGNEAKTVTFPVSFQYTGNSVQLTQSGQANACSAGVAVRTITDKTFIINFTNERSDQGVSAYWYAMGK